MTDILTVTHERPEFAPWASFVVGRMSGVSSWIVVDSSETPAPELWQGVKYLHAPLANIPEKRNLALAMSSAEWIMWQDDDDWSHPQKGKILRAINPEADIAGSLYTWFVDLHTREVERHGRERGLPFLNTIIARRELAQAVQFNEAQTRGSDIAWLDQLCQNRDVATARLPVSFILCHDKNIGNTRDAHNYKYSINDISNVVGRKAWGKTTSNMTALARRIWS
jgi:glycosyltransferase involved in cell wall biosynthesis